MDERLQRLQALILDQANAFNRRMIGRRMPVLFERDGNRAGQRLGKSPYLQSVHVKDGGIAIGDLREVEIVASSGVSLEGRLPEGARGARAA
jgi:tRNA-2-methylthio-N6-dimethylallyladenosine synthase